MEKVKTDSSGILLVLLARECFIECAIIALIVTSAAMSATALPFIVPCHALLWSSSLLSCLWLSPTAVEVVPKI